MSLLLDRRFWAGGVAEVIVTFGWDVNRLITLVGYIAMMVL
jgi:hypothetical protein